MFTLSTYAFDFDTYGATVSTMTEPLSDYEAALVAIRESGLKHPDGRLLESFVENSANHDRAAAYLLNRVSTSTHTPDLGAFLAEWKRIIAMCG